MPKRPLADAGASKLAQQVQSEGRRAGPEASTLMKPSASSPQPKSYRLTPADLTRLRSTTARVGETAGRPISETDLIKGLLLIGERTDAKKLLTAIKDAVFEG
jgi:hypothetical protein